MILVYTPPRGNLMKVKKIGRNDPCPCGSGLKYKRCYLSQQTHCKLKEFRYPQETYIEGGRLVGRPVVTAFFKDKRVVAVGNRIYHSLPLSTTFHEFLLRFTKDLLGLEWGLSEQQKPIESQHIIVQWIHEMAEHIKTSPYRVENKTLDIKSAPMSGNCKALLSLCHDLYSIYHCAEVPDELLSRLKNSEQFQGARYEIAVAAIFVRAGFTIEWIPRIANNSPCEFKATHKEMQEKIIVEAKSRHRNGVLKRSGLLKSLNEMKAEMGELYHKALKKNTEGLPYMIFMDVNLPLERYNQEIESRRWIRDIRKMIHVNNKNYGPEPYCALFVTNFSWHYYEQDINLRVGETFVTTPNRHTIPLCNPEIIELIGEACIQYGNVPASFPLE